MVLKRLNKERRSPLGLKWRILLPTLGLMWLVSIGTAIYYSMHEEGVRTRIIQRNLDMAASSVIRAYDQGVDINQYIDFLRQYYDNTSFTGIRISAYNFNGQLINSVGAPIPFGMKNYGTMVRSSELPEEYANDFTEDPHAKDRSLFYLKSTSTNNGKLIVLTAMPYTAIIDNSLGDADRIWYVILPILLVVTILVYVIVHHLTRSLSLLMKFANDAANHDILNTYYDFPNDEFGHISKQVVRLYRDKERMMAERDKEHSITLNAIEEKSRFKREIISNVNHELKTPAGIVKGYIDTILSQPDMSPEMVRHFLERAQTNTNRLCNLMNDISTINRLDEGAQQIQVGPCNIHDMMYTLIDDATKAGLMRGMKFNLDVPIDLLVTGNFNLINNILNNLVRNAVRHSQGTEMGLELIDTSNRFYTFRFWDNGVGVPPDSVLKLFDRFYRVDKGRTRRTGDTGLGLPIVQSSVQALGGAISVRNRSTGGLEFIFTLESWSAHQAAMKDDTTDKASPTDDKDE